MFGAEVSSDEHSSIADENGLFTLAAACPSNSLYATRETGQSTSVELVDRDLREPIEIRFSATGTIKGVVSNAPAETKVEVSAGSTRAQVVDGHFELFGVPEGDQTVGVFAAGRYSAHPVSVKADDSVHLEVEFEDWYPVRLLFTVNDEPYSGSASVHRRRSAGSSRTSESLDVRFNNGLAVLKNGKPLMLEAGTYAVSILDQLGPFTSEPFAVGGPSDIPQEIRLATNTSMIRGRVAVLGGNGEGFKPGIKVDAYGTTISPHGHQYTDRTNENGEFEIGPVYDGAWSVSANAESYKQVHQQTMLPLSVPLELALTPLRTITLAIQSTEGEVLPERLRFEVKRLPEEKETVLTGGVHLDRQGLLKIELPPGLFHVHVFIYGPGGKQVLVAERVQVGSDDMLVRLTVPAQP